MQTLTCKSCRTDWHRETQKGRKPRFCPDCVAKAAEMGLTVQALAGRVRAEALIARLQSRGNPDGF